MIAQMTNECLNFDLSEQKMSIPMFEYMIKSITLKVRFILSLNLSHNTWLQDHRVLKLIPIIKKARSLYLLNLESTSITHISALEIVTAFPKRNSLKSLNLNGNKLGTLFFDEFGVVLSKGALPVLQSISLSNTGLCDSSALKLFTAILKSSVENVNFSLNDLKYKTGAGIISLLSANSTAQIKAVNLNYTKISRSLINTISEILSSKKIQRSRNNLLYSNTNLRIQTTHSIERTRNIMPPRTCCARSLINKDDKLFRNWTVNRLNVDPLTSFYLNEKNLGVEYEPKTVKHESIKRSRDKSLEAYAQKGQLFDSRRSSVPTRDSKILKRSLEYNKATEEFTKNPASNPKDRLNQIKQLVKASSNLISNWEYNKLPTHNIQSSDTKNTDNLKVIVADQIQKLLSIYKEIEVNSSSANYLKRDESNTFIRFNESSINCNNSVVKDESLIYEREHYTNSINDVCPNKYMELNNVLFES